ncbi:MAG: DNA cytosine methyltransferase [Candidatus Oceanisphaera merdipullorum]|nr:DNA cytosine methyltransferase [Candidatus Oceanisphaera merdipullorum]
MINKKVSTTTLQKDKQKPTVVDLFAGAGGLSLAAISSGFELKLAIENDKHAVDTYRKNILYRPGGTDVVVLDESILEYDPKDIQKQYLAKNGCDLLLGGPPCQGFSTHRILDSGVDDPRNQLVLAYFEFVKSLKPKAFLMENVPGILWKRHKPYIDKFYSEGKKAGYQLFEPIVLDARDYGVPQRRKRVFILGLREDLDKNKFAWPPKPTHCDPQKQEGVLEPWMPCCDVFQNASLEDINNLHMNHSQVLIDVFKKTPLNGGSRKDSGRILNCHKNHDGHKDVYGRIDPSQPAPTMTTACINPSKGRFVHPTEHHGITVRQAARIQTFPDDYIFYGGITAAGKQIGNAVPVDLGVALLSHIKEHLNEQS